MRVPFHLEAFDLFPSVREPWWLGEIDSREICRPDWCWWWPASPDGRRS